MVEIKTDFSKLEFALARLANAAKVELGPVIKEESRYLIKTFIQFTPPKSLAQGKKAVARDIGKLTATLDYASLKTKATPGGFYESMARMVRKRQTEKLRILFQNPHLGFYNGRKMMGSVDELANLHRSQRNNRGRITRDGGGVAYSGDVKAFRNQIQSRVGYTAAGWIPAARITGAPYKKFSDRFGGKNGTVSANFGANPFIIATNTQVKIPDYQRMVNSAVKSREKITLLKVERVLANKAVNLGFTRVQGGSPALPIAA